MGWWAVQRSIQGGHYTGNPHRYRGLQLFSILSNRGNRIITQPQQENNYLFILFIFATPPLQWL